MLPLDFDYSVEELTKAQGNSLTVRQQMVRVNSRFSGS
jgi:hypothetical protein